MRERVRRAIENWAREHPAFGPHVHPDEMDELVLRIEGIVLDYYAKVLKAPE